MPTLRITELEAQLLASNDQVEKLNKIIVELNQSLANAELMVKKARRNSRNDSSVLRDQISVLQSRRG